MGRLFGTDGIRGIANKELTADMAYRIGQVSAYVLTEPMQKPRIIIGTDTRISCDMLESALVAGICSVGVKAYCVGVIPTPAVSYLTRKHNADAGIMISASHNPYEFNGIKIFNNKGYKLPDEVEERIESIILDKSEKIDLPEGKGIGNKCNAHKFTDEYIKFIKETSKYSLDGLKVSVDCSNGSASNIAPVVLKELGAEVFTINNQPDGTNINDNCGSTKLDKISNFVVQCKSDIGIAFDGDADRVLAVDENGEVVDGDRIMAIIGHDMKKTGKLNKNTVVATVMSNIGLDIMAQNEGINVIRTKVGDRYVVEKMLEEGYSIGGEQSGHIVLIDNNSTGDGLLTSVRLLNILKSSNKRLSELASIMKVFPQVLKNAKVNNNKKKEYLSDEVILKKCNELSEEFAGEGRVLVRPSGTEPLIRVMIEGSDIKRIAGKADELVRIIEERLN